MRHISIAKTAMSVGTAVAAWHAIWITLVGLGWAASVLNFILELHFLKIDFHLTPYSGFTAFNLIAITFCFGALFGAIFAIIWNWLSVADQSDWTSDTKLPSATTR